MTATPGSLNAAAIRPGYTGPGRDYVATDPLHQKLSKPVEPSYRHSNRLNKRHETSSAGQTSTLKRPACAPSRTAEWVRAWR